MVRLNELHGRGTIRRQDSRRSRAALRRTVSLNREFVPGGIAFCGSRSRRATPSRRRVLGELTPALRRYVGTRRPVQRLLYRHLDHLARTNGYDQDCQQSRSAFGTGYRPSANGMTDRMPGGIARYEFHRARIDLAEGQLKSGLGPPGFQWQVIAYSWASRGAWDSALVAMDHAAGTNVTPVAGLFGYRLAAVGVWLARSGLPLPRLACSRDRLVRSHASQAAPSTWIDGLQPLDATPQRSRGPGESCGKSAPPMSAPWTAPWPHWRPISRATGGVRSTCSWHWNTTANASATATRTSLE
jgi:hypothetical protein